MVDQFTFELMVTFIESLSLAHKDDKSLGKNYVFLFPIIPTASEYYAINLQIGDF